MSKQDSPLALENLDLDYLDNSMAQTADKQLQVFHAFYAMGEERDIKELASATGISALKLKSWRKRYNWDRRIRALDSKVTSLIDDKFADLYSEVKAVAVQSLFDLLTCARDDIEEGRLKIESIKDLETVMKLDLLLKGQATERKESKNVVLSLQQDLSNMSTEELNNIIEAEEVE
jgi:hypothetical protein